MLTSNDSDWHAGVLRLVHHIAGTAALVEIGVKGKDEIGPVTEHGPVADRASCSAVSLPFGRMFD